MRIAETILLSLSRPVGSADPSKHRTEMRKRDPLALLRQEYPELNDILRGKRVVDFGSSLGLQSIALAREYGCTVRGIEINPKHLEKAVELARQESMPQVTFCFRVDEDMKGQYDVVISQNSMEHYSDPGATLNEMASLVKPGGKILITFGPPWFAPYGSHMHFFCRVPWINLLFSERVVMNVRQRFRDDGAKRYEEVESGLNKMTVGKFERLIRQCGLHMERVGYTCVRRLNFLARMPLLRELFINHVTCVLTK